ncbi:MAG TPA: phage portal protein [Candidatus Sulfotelmatobacter sp.]|jgi:HK97 family phage portal protein
MGLISETRTSLENPQTPLSYPSEWLLDIFNGGRTDSGIRVSEMTALQVSTIWACCEIKGGAIGALELKIFEKLVTDSGRLKRRIAHDHDYWDLLEHEPNSEMSAFTMKKTVQVHRMLWGNGYIEIQRDRSGRIIALWPRNPARIRPHRVIAPIPVTTSDGIVLTARPGQMVYVTTEGMETESMNPESPSFDAAGPHGDRYIFPEDVMHIPGLSLDGRIGQDVIQLARNAVGLALATEKFGAKFFGNGAIGRGVFKIPGTLTPEDMANLRKEVQEAWGGENANRPMVLDSGMEYVATSTKPNEAQFLETREHEVIELCRIFTTPPHMVGVTEKTSRANTEQIGQEFLTFSLAPDLCAWEQEVKRKMLPSPDRGRNAAKRFGVFFDTWPLVTPSANDLRAFVQAMIQWGVWEPNDARERMHMNPLDTPAADSTWMQINMAPVDQLFETPALPGAGDDENNEPADDGAKPGSKKRTARTEELLVARLSRAYSRVFRDAFGRICRRSQADESTFRQVFLPVLVSIGEELEQYAAQILGTVTSPDGLESSRFLAGYLGTMFHRFEGESWASANGSAHEICVRELSRAIRALAIEAYRNAATAAAKLETEVES